MSAQFTLVLPESRSARWLSQNPGIVKAFCDFALKMQRRGISRGSADDICHHLRWRTLWREKKSTLKINNNATAWLAREAVRRHPRLRGFFAMREIRCAG